MNSVLIDNRRYIEVDVAVAAAWRRGE